MADAGAAGRAGKASVGDQRDRAAQAASHDRGGRVEHFAHAGTALGTLVADDDDVAVGDEAVVDRLHRLLLGVKDLRGTRMLEHFGRDCRALYHAAVGRQIAAQHRDAAGGAVGLLSGADDVGVLVEHARDILGDGLARAGDQVGFQQTELVDLVHHGIDAARLVEVLHVGSARGRQMAEVGRLGGDLVGDIGVEVDAALVRDRGQVEHRVGGAAERHIHGQRVAERVLGHDVAGLDILFQQLHDLHARVLRKLDALGIRRGDGAVAAQTHAQDLGEAVHGIRGVHARAGAAAGAGLVLIFLQLVERQLARVVGAERLEHARETGFCAGNASRQHGTAADKNRGDIQTRRRHQQTGHVLVAVGHHDQRVERVRDRHRLGGVRDQVARHERILHALVSHGDTVADGDRGKYDGVAARHRHARLDGVDDLVDVHVTGHDLIVGADNADQRLLKLLLGHTERPKQGTLRRTLDGGSYCVTSHW